MKEQEGRREKEDAIDYYHLDLPFVRRTMDPRFIEDLIKDPVKL